MRLATVVLLVLLGLVHAELWFGDGGLPRVRDLEQRLAHQRTDNDAARARNERLRAEVLDLKEGLEMVEESARRELGMVKPDEILVQVVAGGPSAASGALAPPSAVAPVPSFVARTPEPQRPRPAASRPAPRPPAARPASAAAR